MASFYILLRRLPEGSGRNNKNPQLSGQLCHLMTLLQIQARMES